MAFLEADSVSEHRIPGPEPFLVAQVIMYDEPTAGLDPVASTVVEDLIRSLHVNKASDLCLLGMIAAALQRRCQSHGAPVWRLRQVARSTGRLLQITCSSRPRGSTAVECPATHRRQPCADARGCWCCRVGRRSRRPASAAASPPTSWSPTSTPPSGALWTGGGLRPSTLPQRYFVGVLYHAQEDQLEWLTLRMCRWDPAYCELDVFEM